MSIQAASPIRTYVQVRKELRGAGICQTSWLSARRMQFLNETEYKSLVSLAFDHNINRIKLPRLKDLEIGFEH